jgi:hypothetical protein
LLPELLPKIAPVFDLIPLIGGAKGSNALTPCMPFQPYVNGMLYDVLFFLHNGRVGPGRCGMVATEASYRSQLLTQPRSDLAIPPIGAE